MLDFYIIEDDRSGPPNPEQMNLEFAGGVDDDTFGNLQKKGIIDTRFGYHSHFRWRTIVIRQIRQIISNKKIDSDTDVKKLVELLDIAQANNSGLIAYGD